DTGDVDLGRRFGEREEARPEPDARLGPEEPPEKVDEHALQVGKADPFLDHEALDLLEHRRVGRVEVIAPVDGARHDDAEWRRRPGSVTSIRSCARLSASRAAASRSPATATAAWTASFAWLTSAPSAGRSAGGTRPRPRTASVSDPFRPRYRTRTASSSASVP